MKKYFIWMALALFLILSCDDQDSDNSEISSSGYSLVDLSIEPRELEIQVAETASFIVLGLLVGGESKDLTSEVEWESSSPEIAIVEDGVIKTRGVGETEIMVSCQGFQATATIKINSIPNLIGVTISSLSNYSQVEIDRGSLNLKATAFLSSSSSFDITDSIFWEVAEPTIASVDSGVVKGLRVGSTIVSVSLGGFFDFFEIEVLNMSFDFKLLNNYGEVSLVYEVWEQTNFNSATDFFYYHYLTGQVVGKGHKAEINNVVNEIIPYNETGQFRIKINDPDNAIFLIIGVLYEGNKYYVADYFISDTKSDLSFKLNREGALERVNE